MAYSWHKIVPFVGDLTPPPEIADPNAVVLFGAYTMWKYAQAKGLKPGVFRIAPFVHQTARHPYLLNGADALFLTLSDIPERLPDDGTDWFLRPVADSKEQPGTVKSAAEIRALAQRVLAIDPSDIPRGSLRPDTELMLTPPARIEREWRIWAVEDRIVTYSLYKEGARVTYRHEIDPDAMAFVERLVAVNPDDAPAYVIDICRTSEGLRMLETNCINAAGFYEADLEKLVRAINAMSRAS